MATSSGLFFSNGSTATIDEDNAVQHSPTNHHLNEQLRQRVPGEALLLQHQVLDLGQEPRVDVRVLVRLLQRHAVTERVRHVPDAVGADVAHAGLLLHGHVLFVSYDASGPRSQSMTSAPGSPISRCLNGWNRRSSR